MTLPTGDGLDPSTNRLAQSAVSTTNCQPITPPTFTALVTAVMTS